MEPQANLGGLPQAKHWTDQFAAHLPFRSATRSSTRELVDAVVRHLTAMFVAPASTPPPVLQPWVYRAAKALLHARLRDLSTGMTVRLIDAKGAELLGFTRHGIGLGERVDDMARCWIARADNPDDPDAAAALTAAENAYNDQVEQLLEVWPGGA